MAITIISFVLRSWMKINSLTTGYALCRKRNLRILPLFTNFEPQGPDIDWTAFLDERVGAILRQGIVLGGR